jgi:HD-GYP domain-containing protein (c-di-GMP phosphodiesterase class II)
MTKKKDNLLKLPSIQTTVSIMHLAKKCNDLEQMNKQVAEMAARSILQALEAKDSYTYGHSMRVTYFALVIGKELEFNDEEIYDLEMSALFHDIGKIGVPDHILNKPARLDDDEFLQMKKHPELSAEILRGFEPFKNAAVNARHHHERYDGRGYPDGLKGDDIPLFSRIILIADTFDAMTSTRPYREGLPFAVAFEELLQFAGSQFDADMVKAFIRGMRKEERAGKKDFFLPIMKKSYDKDAA